MSGAVDGVRAITRAAIGDIANERGGGDNRVTKAVGCEDDDDDDGDETTDSDGVGDKVGKKTASRHMAALLAGSTMGFLIGPFAAGQLTSE